MQRELIKWLQSLDLTYPVRHPQQDLSNGFILAEIASRYDRRVAMHSYIPGCSTECKRRNWNILLRDLRRIGCPAITSELAEGAVQSRSGAAITALEELYEFFNGHALHRRASNLPAALLDVMASSTNHSNEESHSPEGPLRQRVMENDEIAKCTSRRLEPGFARPTAATLLHVANKDARNAPLVAAVPVDELRTHKRNEKLLNEHEMLQKAYRFVEPQRYAPVQRQRQEFKGRHGASAASTTTPRITSAHAEQGQKRHTHHRLNTEDIPSVEVKVMNERLLAAMRARGDADGGDEFADNLQTPVQMLFESCGNSIRLTMSRLLQPTLEAHDVQCTFEAYCTTNGGDYETDLFCAFLGLRDVLPFDAAAACWEDLLRAADPIAASLIEHQADRNYLMRTMHFISTLEVAQIRLLHVTSPASAAPQTPARRPRGASVGDAFLAAAGDPSDEPQQAILSNEKAFHVASAFGLLCRVGEALCGLSPEISKVILTSHVIPALTRHLSSASTAYLEALARVVVAHTCGDRSTMGYSTDGIECLKDLIFGPLHSAFSASEAGMSSFYLFLYHVLCQSRSDAMSQPEAQDLVELLADGFYKCVSSPRLHERSISLAALLETLAWDRWDLVIDPLVCLVTDVTGRGAASGLLSRSAGSWECRVLLLEVLTVAFRKALYVIAEDEEETLKMTTRTSETQDGFMVSDAANLIRGQLNLSTMEEAIATCLLTFLTAPLLQRQLALRIVGRRLLPDEQRNLAAVWLRLLFTFGVDQLDFLLRPHEGIPLRMVDPLKAHLIDRRVSAIGTKHAVKADRISPVDSEETWSRKRKGSPAVSPSFEKMIIPSESISSLRVLLGRVEPAYIVAPLNQSWDTFSVVQATLMFEDILTTTQVFSVVVAALLSPQQSEVQRRRLMQNLRAVDAGHVETPDELSQKGTKKTTETTTPSSTEKKKMAGEDEEEPPLAITLRSLVTTYGRVDNTQSLQSPSTHSDVKVAVGERNEPTDAEVPNEEKEREDDDALPQEEDKEGGEKANDDSMNAEEEMDAHVAAFWMSVLRLLRPQLEESLTPTPGKDRRRKGKEETEPKLTVCRIGAGESCAQLQGLSMAILLALYRRYGETTSTEYFRGDEELQAAQEWLANM